MPAMAFRLSIIMAEMMLADSPVLCGGSDLHADLQSLLFEPSLSRH